MKIQLNDKQLYQMILGNHIRLKRKERDLTQEELAAEIEINAKHLGKIEQGSREPRALLLGKIEYALALDKKAIFEEYLEAIRKRDGGS